MTDSDFGSGPESGVESASVAPRDGRREASWRWVTADAWAPRLVLAAVAAMLVASGWALGWRGVDLPAQLYRVEEFRRHGLVLWDSQWYGGHWTLDYSVVYPAIAALTGLAVLAVCCAAVATAAFDAMAVRYFGAPARAGSAVFACSVVVETAIGQLTFLSGEALGLACLWCLAGRPRRRPVAAASLALAATLASPLAGAFVALAALSWGLWTGADAADPLGAADASAIGDSSEVGEDSRGQRLRRWRSSATQGFERSEWGPAAAVIVAVMVPVAATSVLFPGQGPMPYPFFDWAWEAVVAAALWRLVGVQRRLLRIAIVLYGTVTVLSVAVASPLGGNIGRLEDVVALPVAVIVVVADRQDAVRRLSSLHFSWPARNRSASSSAAPLWVLRWSSPVVLLGSLLVSQWSPAWPAISASADQPWTSSNYFAPLVRWLTLDSTHGRSGTPLAGARVEVIPTADHAEAAYVAPSVPLARGWERQLDVADNPLFYGLSSLTSTTYLAWLHANGVRWVAVPSAPLDPAGIEEARVVDSVVPGLHKAWVTPDWTVYRVTGPGIVTGPARLLTMQGPRVVLDVGAPGAVIVRIRWAAHWQVTSGAARLAEAPGGWTALQVSGPERLTLGAGFGL